MYLYNAYIYTYILFNYASNGPLLQYYLTPCRNLAIRINNIFNHFLHKYNYQSQMKVAYNVNPNDSAVSRFFQNVGHVAHHLLYVQSLKKVKISSYNILIDVFYHY